MGTALKIGDKVKLKPSPGLFTQHPDLRGVVGEVEALGIKERFVTVLYPDGQKLQGAKPEEFVHA